MTYLAPLLTVALFVCGVIVWRLQLVAKRRFEVAEQALSAFYRASDGLSRLRAMMIWAGELASVEVPSNVGKEEEMRVRRYNVYAARAEAATPAFADLRTAQILAEIHLGAAAARAMDVPFRCRQEVFVAVDELHGGMPSSAAGMQGDALKEHNEFQASMRRAISERRSADGTPRDDDALSKKLDVAKLELEAACRPFLDDPPWLKKVTRALSRRGSSFGLEGSAVDG
jgi:hypothetical protein